MTEIWYRIDAGDGTVEETTMEKVERAADINYIYAEDAICGGRFRTPFAIYTRKDRLTDDEVRDVA